METHQETPTGICDNSSSPGNGSASTPTPAPQAINIDIQELERLRDVIGYKAKVLRLQERTFKTKEKEQMAAKRALLDFIITLFGYMTNSEAQQLMSRICKEYNMKLDELIVKTINGTNNVRDKELQIKSHFKNLQAAREATITNDKKDDTQNYDITQNLIEQERRGNAANYRQMSTCERFIDETRELRKSYAVSNYGLKFLGGANGAPVAFGRDLIAKLLYVQNGIREAIQNLQLQSGTTAQPQQYTSGDALMFPQQQPNDLIRFSINKSHLYDQQEQTCSYRVSLKNGAVGNNGGGVRNTTTLFNEDKLKDVASQIKIMQEQLQKILVEDLNFERTQSMIQQQDFYGIFEERMQPQTLESPRKSLYMSNYFQQQEYYMAQNSEHIFEKEEEKLFEDHLMYVQKRNSKDKDDGGEGMLVIDNTNQDDDDMEYDDTLQPQFMQRHCQILNDSMSSSSSRSNHHQQQEKEEEERQRTEIQKFQQKEFAVHIMPVEEEVEKVEPHEEERKSQVVVAASHQVNQRDVSIQAVIEEEPRVSIKLAFDKGEEDVKEKQRVEELSLDVLLYKQMKVEQDQQEEVVVVSRAKEYSKPLGKLQMVSEESLLSDEKENDNGKEAFKAEDTPAHDLSGEDSSAEIIPIQLRRYMIFKRERSYAIIVHEDYIVLDGLNGNVDIFKADDFTLLATLDTNESSMISGIFIEDKLYIACSDKSLYVYDYKQNFKLIHHLFASNNINCFLFMPESNYLLCGERWARIEVFDLVNKMKMVHSQKMHQTGHIIQLVKTYEQHEVAMATDKGLYFGKVRVNNQRSNQMNVIYKKDEVYFPGQHVRGVIQLSSSRRKMVTCVDEADYLFIIDRHQRRVIQKIQLASGNKGPICMRMVVDDSIFVRDQQGVNLVDLETNQCIMVDRSPNELAPYPQYQMEAMMDESGHIKMFLIEYDGLHSKLKRFEMNGNYVKAAFYLEFADQQTGPIY